MKEKIISEINLDLVFQCNDFSQFSNKLKDTKTHLIFESIFWEKVFLSWINTILKKEDYELPNYIYEKKSFSLGLQIISNSEITEEKSYSEYLIFKHIYSLQSYNKFNKSFGKLGNFLISSLMKFFINMRSLSQMSIALP